MVQKIMYKIIASCMVAVLLAGCANLDDQLIDSSPSLTATASCTPLYLSDKKKAGPIHESNMKNFLSGSYSLYKMGQALDRSGYSRICWKVFAQNTRARTIVAIGESADLDFAVEGKLTPKTTFGGFLPTPKSYFFTITSNASSANPYRFIVNFSSTINGGGYLTRIRQVGSSQKIHDYPVRGPYKGTDTIGAMINFAKPASTSSASKFEYDSERNSFNLVPQATSTTAVNYSYGTPIVSVKEAIESRGLAVQFESECESQKFPNDPCPQPPAVVPIPSPNVSVEVCEKRECGDKVRTFASRYGTTVVLEFRFFYDVGKTIASCASAVKTGAYGECGTAASFVAIDLGATVAGVRATDTAFGSMRSCLRQPREVCHTYY